MSASYLRRYCFGLAAIAVLVFSVPAAYAQTWGGSTGTVDPNSVNLVKYINGRVELRNDAPVGSVAFIRYNVLPVRDLATELNSAEYRVFDARFLDDGAGHVFLSLIQQNLSTGTLTTLMTFDSNASAQALHISGEIRQVIPRSISSGPTLKASILLIASITWKRSSAAMLLADRPVWQDFPLRKSFLSCCRKQALFRESNRLPLRSRFLSQLMSRTQMWINAGMVPARQANWDDIQKRGPTLKRVKICSENHDQRRT
jgi:hypothetical protein